METALSQPTILRMSKITEETYDYQCRINELVHSTVITIYFWSSATVNVNRSSSVYKLTLGSHADPLSFCLNKTRGPTESYEFSIIHAFFTRRSWTSRLSHSGGSSRLTASRRLLETTSHRTTQGMKINSASSLGMALKTPKTRRTGHTAKRYSGLLPLNASSLRSPSHRVFSAQPRASRQTSIMSRRKS